MSVWNRSYTCRLAPCSETWREAIYNGVEVVDDGKVMRESWAPDAFIASDKPVPVILSHDESKPVGHLVNRIVHNGWHIGEFVLDASHTLACIAADRLEHGTPVSIGARSLAHDKLLAQGNVLRHTLARLDELSILAPNELPYYPDARVTHIYEPKAKPIMRAPRAWTRTGGCRFLRQRRDGPPIFRHHDHGALILALRGTYGASPRTGSRNGLCVGPVLDAAHEVED